MFKIVRAAIMRRSSNPLTDDSIDDPIVEGLEEGTLAIQSDRVVNVKDTWKRPTRRNISIDGTRLRFEIPYARVLPSNDQENIKFKKFVIYDVTVYQDGQLNTIDSNPITIERRYTHFLTLYNGLKKDHWTLLQRVYFPKKVLLGNFSAELIGERSAAFETFLDYIVNSPVLRESSYFLQFLQDIELNNACQLLDERRNEQAVPILENCFRLLNKIYTDRSKAVLLLLCRLVAACTTSPVPHQSAEKWTELALVRFDSVSDADLLVLYVPLLQASHHLWWQRGRDNQFLENRLNNISLKGINIKNTKTLTQIIHSIDPRTETN